MDIPLENPVSHHLGYRLRRASVTTMTEIAQALEEIGLTVAQATILLIIQANEGCRQRDICGELDIQRANMTPLIARLRALNLIERSAIDGRSQAMRLTPEGAALAKRAAKTFASHEAWCRRRYTAAELVLLDDLLGRMEVKMV